MESISGEKREVMNLTYLGHSCFEISVASEKILIDPFLVLSPDYDAYGVSDVYVTHAHSDHLGSAIEISKKYGATITAIFELANYCTQLGAKSNGIGLGGCIKRSYGSVVAVPSLHSSSLPNGQYGGNPCGYVFKTDNTTIYHAGDTSLTYEMKMIGEVYKPDIVILPIGGHYTMDIEQAVIASEWLNANIIIPMHYNTFPAISVDINEFENKIKSIGKTPVILRVGEQYNL